MSQYTITLIEEDGRHVSQVIAQALPRHIHLHPHGDMIIAELSDDDSDDPTAISFDRLGSSVWVDDARNALFVARRSP